MRLHVISLIAGVLLLTGCSNYGEPLGLDGDRVFAAVKEHTIELEEFESDYTERDIELERICAVADEDFEVIYRIFWQTSDAPRANYGGYYVTFMEEPDYQLVNNAPKDIYNSIGCHEFN
ncbi:hypothetical protein FLK61_26500 [Paenalkalicoccus suaedae]|uniref:Uncharacterized protein n=1 Tax=Paenalkalicoccus suaedae TaxID=2592382 RepID=A0A859FC11_9BACI|nr:hypothetical protein [Paenalkalicoccus suaedae]QKS70312.1 hypothetical protein FLK61_26500 [Paenalkalicoccus suaedae]